MCQRNRICRVCSILPRLKDIAIRRSKGNDDLEDRGSKELMTEYGRHYQRYQITGPAVQIAVSGFRHSLLVPTSSLGYLRTPHTVGKCFGSFD